MTEHTREKRKQLGQLSNQLKNNAKAINYDYLTVNQLLFDFCYNPDKSLEFNTFNQWKDKGFRVKKGEKAFLIWARPVGSKKDNENNEPAKISDNEDDYSFFPLCYVFSNKQVEKT